MGIMCDGSSVKKPIKFRVNTKPSSPLYQGECRFCDCKNDGDWDNRYEDNVCIKCHELWEYNEDTDEYDKIKKPIKIKAKTIDEFIKKYEASITCDDCGKLWCECPCTCSEGQWCIHD